MRLGGLVEMCGRFGEEKSLAPSEISTSDFQPENHSLYRPPRKKKHVAGVYTKR
jgi:hypothetical protein